VQHVLTLCCYGLIASLDTNPCPMAPADSAICIVGVQTASAQAAWFPRRPAASRYETVGTAGATLRWLVTGGLRTQQAARVAEAEVQVAALQRLLRPRHRRLAAPAPAELQVLRPANIIQRLASLSPQLQQNSITALLLARPPCPITMAQRHDRVDGLGTVLALLTCVQHHENGKQAEGEPGIEQTPDAVAAVTRQRGAHERPRQQPVALQVRLRRHGAVLPLVGRQQLVQRPKGQLVWHLCTGPFCRLQRSVIIAVLVGTWKSKTMLVISVGIFGSPCAPTQHHTVHGSPLRDPASRHARLRVAGAGLHLCNCAQLLRSASIWRVACGHLQVV
jgi:hypothetical protein